MTASKKTVRTRRGVEPAGRPARREVGRGRGARTNSSMIYMYYFWHVLQVKAHACSGMKVCGSSGSSAVPWGQ